MYTDMREPIVTRTGQDRFARHLREFAAEFFLDIREVFFQAPRIKHIFEARLGAVGAVTVLDVDAYDSIGDRSCLSRFDDDSGIARKISVPGNSTEREAKPDARLDTKAIFHGNGLKSDVV